METNLQRWNTTILLVGTASGIFAGFCPSWFTVASPFFHEQEAKAGNVKRIRAGEAAATAIVLAMGWAVSSSTGDRKALVSAAIICGVFVGGYEYQIAHPSSDDSDTTTGSLWTREPRKDN